MSLPKPIYRITKNKEVITMEALSNITYEKCYFDDFEYGKPLQNPRKIKVIDVTTIGKYKSVDEYFKYLVNKEHYQFI